LDAKVEQQLHKFYNEFDSFVSAVAHLAV